MKNRHNKKRNTAFVFEALAREATVAIIKGDNERKEKVVSIVRKHFTTDSLLKKDLECYRSLYENQDLDEPTSKKIMEAAMAAKRLIDADGLFKQQTAVINDINKDLSPDTFNNFVPNYKSLATIAKMFNTNSPKQSVMLEARIVEGMTGKYGSSLLEEQKNLLNNYISSFSQDDLEAKIYFNRELGRLKQSLSEATKIEEIANDPEMLKKTQAVRERLETLSKETSLNESTLLTIMKTQQLVKEIHDDADHS
jgi:hypothetical protein